MWKGRVIHTHVLQETRDSALCTCVRQALAGAHGVKWALLGMGRRDSWRQSCQHSSFAAGDGGKTSAARNTGWHQIILWALFEQRGVQVLFLHLNEDQNSWRPLRTHPLPQLPARHARSKHFSTAAETGSLKPRRQLLVIAG